MDFPASIKINEPSLTFEALTPKPFHIHPLEGLIEFGPYSSKIVPIQKIRIGVICPKSTFHVVRNLVAEFNQKHEPRERKKYLPSYIGFENIFKTTIELLDENVAIEIDATDYFSSSNKKYITLSQLLGNAIQSASQNRQDFDVLYIYLPEAWQEGFIDSETNFDLHDFIKAKTAVSGIPTQILRESSAIKYACRCSVMWRLSIALYVKAGGVPWKLSTMTNEMAFIGLSYSSRMNPQTDQFDFTTCCSQVFDSDGTGLEFIAYDTGEVEFRDGENPFLSRAEMRKVVSKSLDLYQKRHSGRLPKHLIIHKTSHFTGNEIDGAFDALPPQIKLELLQIVENTKWRGIKYLRSGQNVKAEGYPIERGTYVQTGPNEVLLWTQGNVQLRKGPFYKEGKNIPAPITIRRFAGDGGWHQNCQAIIGLTKMNWNHDALYDRLPVTLGYAKTLATTIRRMSNMVNKPYEFRYFM